jgi:streptogramin lyase
MDRRRLILPTLVIALLGALAPAGVAGASDLVEFSAGLTPNSKPAGIARSADGNLWVAGYAKPARIIRVTPSGDITEFTEGLNHEAFPTGITGGPDGNVWFTESKRAAIGRITPQGEITEFMLGMSSDSNPQDIVAGPDGNLWFTERSGRIGRITPTGIVTEFSAGIPDGAKPRGITAGPDGNLWFTDVSSAARIGRITTAGVITMFNDKIPSNSIPFDIAPGGDGNLWFTLTATSRIGRITPAGDVTIFDTLGDFSLPLGITQGPDGRVWVTELGRGRIAAVAADGSATEHAGVPSSGAMPTGITSGPNGTLWFTEPGVDLSNRLAAHGDDDSGFPGAIGRIDGVGPADSDAGLPPMVETPGDDSGETPGDDSDETPGDGFTPPTGEQPTGAAAEGAQSGAAITEKIEQLTPGNTEQTWSLPEIGKTFVVAPIAGEIRVRRPGALRSGLITSITNIPTGSRIDSSTGALAFVTALPNGRYQMAAFKDGRFDVHQSPDGNGIADLRLRGKTGCGGNGEPDPMLATASKKKAKSSARGRRLWASDRGGRFRTHGRDSVATVRGTEWITEDTCRGTRTTVVKGAVSVRDKHTGRTVLVRAGHSHLVRTR